MLFHINRAGQSYGPYTLADLQRYVTSGHILLTDLTKSDEMPEWTPVARVLNPSAPPPAWGPGPATPAAAYPSQPAGNAQQAADYPQQPGQAAFAAYPDPPSLHWGLVLLFDLLTFHLFQIVWNLVIAAWVKRVDPTNQGFVYYGVGYGLDLLKWALSASMFVAILHGVSPEPHYGLSLLSLVAWITCTIGHFNIKTSLERHFNTVEPLGLRMSGVLTFFFGGLYIQSQLNRVSEIRQAMRYRDFGR